LPIQYWTRLLEDAQLKRRVLRLEECGAGCIVVWSILRPGVLDDEVANQGDEKGICIDTWCLLKNERLPGYPKHSPSHHRGVCTLTEWGRPGHPLMSGSMSGKPLKMWGEASFWQNGVIMQKFGSNAGVL